MAQPVAFLFRLTQPAARAVLLAFQRSEPCGKQVGGVGFQHYQGVFHAGQGIDPPGLEGHRFLGKGQAQRNPPRGGNRLFQALCHGVGIFAGQAGQLQADLQPGKVARVAVGQKDCPLVIQQHHRARSTLDCLADSTQGRVQHGVGHSHPAARLRDRVKP
ncbi:hypothetical protein KU6B_53250 [Mameliella alba]|nr:hypothetical protein KU6B_53250 [Mameliella alba]